MPVHLTEREREVVRLVSLGCTVKEAAAILKLEQLGRLSLDDGIADHFMDPYNEKIWKRPLEQITSDWVAGRVPDAPVADVLKAAIGLRTEGYKHQGQRVVFDLDADGRATGLHMGSEVDMGTPGH